MKPRDRILSLLAGNPPTDRLPLLPITMQIAADAIGRKYRDYALDHNVLVAGQLAIARRFGLDYVSTISDPAREASDYGSAVVLHEDSPPALDESKALLRDKSALRALRLSPPDPLATGSRMRDRIDGIAALRSAVGDELCVEGWVEGPCAEAADLRGISALMVDIIDDPKWVDELFGFLVDRAIEFARAQVRSCADWIGIGDAACSLIGPRHYERAVFAHEKRLVDAIHGMGSRVRLHICGDTRRIAPIAARLGCDLVDVDYFVPMELARQAYGPKQVLCGNLDPVRVLRAAKDPAVVTEAVAKCHAAAGDRFIVGAGCECPRDTPEANMRAMCNYAMTHRP